MKICNKGFFQFSPWFDNYDVKKDLPRKNQKSKASGKGVPLPVNQSNYQRPKE
jgi:hypothetical protein